MARSKNGSPAPSKGKPSGSGKDTAKLRNAFAVTDLEKEEELTEKYTDGPDDPASNVHMRHINRNVNKRENADDDSKRKV